MIVGVHKGASIARSGRATFAHWMKMDLSRNTVGAMLDLYRSVLDPVFGSSEARIMARRVFQESFGWDAAELDMRRTAALSESELLKVHAPLIRLRTGEPFQYVMGHTWFMGMRLRVGPGVLIPRPETEELVDLIGRRGRRFERILDVGTGSGCIALGLKHLFPGALVTGMDVSEQALLIAGQNGMEQQLEVDWRLADVFSFEAPWPRAIDLVISNPPYVPRSEASTLDRHVAEHEPHLALFVSDADPLLFYRVIAERAWESLVEGGEVWFEGHVEHAVKVGGMLEQFGYSSVNVLDDLSGSPRFIHATR